MNSAQRVLIVMTVAAAIGATGRAMFIVPELEDVPIDRLIANLARKIAADPRDANAHMNLARVHALAYARRADEQQADKKTGDPYFGPGAALPPQLVPQAVETAGRPNQHLAEALVHYRHTLALRPTDLFVRLGFAWALDQSGDVEAAKRQYREIIAKAWPKERARRSMSPGEISLTGEAGGYLRRLLDPAKDAAELRAIDARRAEIGRMPRAITPIVVPLRDGVTADRLLDPRRRVLFDADGSGIPRRWTWPGRDAAWLVHDPRKTGRITSALQLFGSVTFWLFWRDGYEALAALDDNGNGSLAGAELAGLALWRDRDGDGISDPGEVRPLADHHIVALSCRAERVTHDPDVAAFASGGVTFADGSRRPTYDVILRAGR